MSEIVFYHLTACLNKFLLTMRGYRKGHGSHFLGLPSPCQTWPFEKWSIFGDTYKPSGYLTAFFSQKSKDGRSDVTAIWSVLQRHGQSQDDNIREQILTWSNTRNISIVGVCVWLGKSWNQSMASRYEVDVTWVKRTRWGHYNGPDVRRESGTMQL